MKTMQDEIQKGNFATWAKEFIVQYSHERISNDQILKCIDDIYIILLDSINVGELEWVFESHSYIKRKGFFTVIDISNLKKGRHDLIIHSNPKYSLNDKFDIGRGLMAGWRNARFKKEIPFYYYPKQ